MKFLKLGLVFGAFVIFAIACTQNATNSNTAPGAKNTGPANVANNDRGSIATPTQDELASAKKIFAEKCVLCHKENGEGGQADIEGDKFKVPNYKDEKVKAADDKKYIRVIEEGDEKMPAFKKKLKPEEIADLVKLIRKEFQGK